MIRIKKRAVGTYTLTATAENEDGVKQNISAPATVTIKDGAGTIVVTGTPTIQNGELSYEADAALMPRLDTYTVNWTGTVSSETWEWTTELELVGGFLFEISDLRAADRAFADTVKYPTDTLKLVRTWVEDVIEGPRAANVAFVPRGKRVVTQGPGVYRAGAYGIDVSDYELRGIYSSTVAGTALTAPQIADLICDDNTIWRTDRPWPAGHRNVSFHYTHGYDTPPGAITRAAIMLAREYLVKSDLPGRATATSIGDQMFRLTIAGRDGVTGLPEVDAAIDQFGRKSFWIG